VPQDVLAKGKPVSLFKSRAVFTEDLAGSNPRSDDGLLYREKILNLTFGVVIFSIVVEGLTIKPLLRVLDLASNYAERES
jgi:NhaP-type Na+/H+ or K+/H+ antiporter